jgi:Raf kinase inhibitor-like YbhB/YbcL family protein
MTTPDALARRRHQLTVATALMGALMATVILAAQNPQTTTPPTPTAPSAPQGGRGGGRGARSIQTMTLESAAWADGGQIPTKYSQAGHDVSPPLAWANAPDPTAAFVLIAHDLDAPIGSGVDDTLQWMLWNIPGTARTIAEAQPQGPQLADGTRQISATGPYYRGPAAPASGPPHHYVFELFALDTMIDIPPVGAAPAAARAAVVAAMAGHVRAKGTLVGVYRRPPAGRP